MQQNHCFVDDYKQNSRYPIIKLNSDFPAALETVGPQAADEVTQQLGASRRQVYILIQ